jgi:hypothetical protein
VTSFTHAAQAWVEDASAKLDLREDLRTYKRVTVPRALIEDYTGIAALHVNPTKLQELGYVAGAIEDVLVIVWYEHGK